MAILTDLYDARCTAGTLQDDPAQRFALSALDGLLSSLGGEEDRRRTSSLPSLIRGALRRLTGKPDRRKRLWPVPAGDGRQGVYLFGEVGRGKSMLMDLFFEALPPAVKPHSRRCHFHVFMAELHQSLHKERKSGSKTDDLLIDHARALAARTRVLCFDEFHVEDVADAMLLGRLFSALFGFGVIVVATSNRPPEDLYKDGLQRGSFLPFIALLKERLIIHNLDGEEDYRTGFLQDSGTWFWPLGTLTHRHIEGMFAQLTHNAPVRRDVIRVRGREITVEDCASCCARFTFAQLCERPHGAEDYLEIIRRWNCLFLEGIPKLGYDRRNEAKRLITLIDVLYDNHVRLVVSADAPPEKIYQGKDHAFTFQRTLSRLLEMQSAPYLKACGCGCAGCEDKTETS